jgi:hypothetical protein
VRLATGESLSIDAASTAGITTRDVLVQMNGGWAMGIDSGPVQLPSWRVELATGRVEIFDPARLSPLRPFDGCGALTQPILQRDGRIAAAFHDDSSGGIFVGTPASSSWERIGRPIDGVLGAVGIQVGPTWVVTAEDGKDTFCSPQAVWRPSQSDGNALGGSSLQVVVGGGKEPLVLPPRSPLYLHPSGLCLLTADGWVRDLLTGTHLEVGPITSAAWW